jgi:flagellar basal-body rod modification protein FlgD
MQLVYSETLGPKAASSAETFEWSGQRFDGTEAPDGVYYVRLSLENTNGQAVMADTLVTGTVEGITTYEGQLYLRLTDGRTVALSDVRELAAAGQGDIGAGGQSGNSSGSGSGSDSSGGSSGDASSGDSGGDSGDA